MEWRGVALGEVESKLLICSGSRLASAKYRFGVSSCQNDAGTSVGLVSRPLQNLRGKRHASGQHSGQL